VEALLLLVLILTNGLLAMSEVALLTSRRGKLQGMAAKGKKSAALVAQRIEQKTFRLQTPPPHRTTYRVVGEKR
jgi:putative hemolysin